MRIHRLILWNLNALSGRWMIDFDHADYVNHGIFAIVGKTGSGKTTLLDAITLALYGRTPRIGRISDKENALMTQGVANCGAEVLFSIVDAQNQWQRYRAVWTQRRAHNRSQGALQAPKHWLMDADGKILAEKINDVRRQIIALTHLNFEQFTRTVLLAQGSFDAFLKAKEDERAPLLERMTGTEIYSDISKATFFAAKEARTAYEQQQTVLVNIELPDAASESALRQRYQHYQNAAQRLHQRQEHYRQLHQAQQQQNDWQQAWQTLQHNLTEHQEQSLAFAADEKRLRQAEKAQMAQPAYQTWQFYAAELDQAQIRQQQGQQALAEANKAVMRQNNVIAKMQHKQVRLQEKINRAAERINQALNLDDLIRRYDAELNSIKNTQQQLHQNLLASQKALEALDLAEQQWQQQAAEDNQIIQEHSRIARRANHHAAAIFYAEQLQKACQQSQALSTINQQLQIQIQTEKPKLDAGITEEGNLENALTASIETQEQYYKNWQKQLDGKTLEAWRKNWQDAVEKSRNLSQADHYHQARATLVDGEPCPLCGATHHPYQNSDHPAVPSQAASEYAHQLRNRLDNIERCADLWQQSQQHSQAITAKLQALQATLAPYIQKQQQWQQQLQENQRQIQALKQNQQQAQTELTKLDIDISATEWQHLDAFIANINHAQSSYQAAKSRQTAHQQQRNQWQQQREKIIQECAEQQGQFQMICQQITAKDQERAASCRQRCQLGGWQDAVAEKNRQQHWQNRISQYVKSQENAQAAAHTTQIMLQQQQEENQQKIIELKQKTQNAWQQFEQKRMEHFSSYAEFLAASLDDAEKQALSAREKQLMASAEALAQQQQQLAQKQTQMVAIWNRLPPSSQLTRWQDRAVRLQEARQRQMGSLAERIDTIDNNRKKYQQAQAQLVALEKNQQRWQHLDQMIGSADGKKYRVFAQGLTFDAVINLANRQLRLLSDRYILARRNAYSLMLDVLDGYRGGEARGTENLSGGESFLVSLALALGLAELASHRARIDTFFLDEGFGTLDEEALNTALSALAELKHQNKVIGIISHVPALKEMMSCQIRVIPRQGGHSILEGSGVSRQNSDKNSVENNS